MIETTVKDESVDGAPPLLQEGCPAQVTIDAMPAPSAQSACEAAGCDYTADNSDPFQSVRHCVRPDCVPAKTLKDIMPPATWAALKKIPSLEAYFYEHLLSHWRKKEMKEWAAQNYVLPEKPGLFKMGIKEDGDWIKVAAGGGGQLFAGTFLPGSVHQRTEGCPDRELVCARSVVVKQLFAERISEDVTETIREYQMHKRLQNSLLARPFLDLSYLIPKLYGLFYDGIFSTHGIVTESLSGGNLEEVLKERKDYLEKDYLEEDEVHAVAVNLFTFLHHIHTVDGIAHLDIKPANLMISGPAVTRNTVKIIDYGVMNSRVRRSGTAMYQPPEVLEWSQGREHRQEVWEEGGVNAAFRSDVWQACVTLAELAGMPMLPDFKGGMKAMWHRYRDSPDYMSQRVDRLLALRDTRTNGIVKRCLDQPWRTRPTAGDMRDMLNALGAPGARAPVQFAALEQEIDALSADVAKLVARG